jgi:ParB family chromosome partitioning protein
MANTGSDGWEQEHQNGRWSAAGNGRAKVEGWVPRWMQFPPSAYTTRGGVGSVNRAGEADALLAQVESESKKPTEAEPERQAA